MTALTKTCEIHIHRQQNERDNKKVWLILAGHAVLTLNGTVACSVNSKPLCHYYCQCKLHQCDTTHYHRTLLPSYLKKYTFTPLHCNRQTVCYMESLRSIFKLNNRNNLLMKLASSTWGASANTLRSSALALCYSVCPSLVTLCLHKSGRCTVELYHASHLWYPPFYTSPMASSALQH